MKKNKIVTDYKNVIFVVVATLVLFLRKSDSLINPQFWAEDGTIFFAQQYENGVRSIFTPYAGYLHVIPRLIAFFADTFFSYTFVPAVYNYTCLAITITVIYHCFSKRLQLPFKPLLALSIVLVPHSLNEVFLNITNIQWILCLLLILTLLKEPPNKKYGNYSLQLISDFIIIIFAGLTGPFLIFIFPFIAWKSIKIRSAYGYSLLLAAFCITSIQLTLIIQNTTGLPENSIFNMNLYMSVIGKQLFGGLFLGKLSKYCNEIISAIGALIYLSILFYISYKKSQKNKQILYIVFMILFISLEILGAVIINFNFSPLIMKISSESRYFYIPYVMIIWALVFCIDQDGIWKNIFVISSLLFILYSSFAAGMQTKMMDYNWKYHSSLIGKKDTLSIPINPSYKIVLHIKK